MRWIRIKLIFRLVLVSTIIIMCLSSCSFHKTEETEADILAKYMMDNSGSDTIEVFECGGDERYFVAYFFGVNDLATVDNTITALYEYLESHEDCVFSLESSIFQIRFYESYPGSLSYDECNWYAYVSNYDTDQRYPPDTIREDGLVYLDMNVVQSLNLSDFADLQNVYKLIEVPPCIELDNLSIFLEMDSLERFHIDRRQYDHLDYDTYVEFCSVIDDINARNGSRLISIEIGALRSRWMEEYGDAFVEPAYMHEE